MVKVTLVSAVVYLNILLFNGCEGFHEAKHGPELEEIRYENKLDTLFERKIDSAYARMGSTCDSTLQAKWMVLSDSIIKSRTGRDSAR